MNAVDRRLVKIWIDRVKIPLERLTLANHLVVITKYEVLFPVKVAENLLSANFVAEEDVAKHPHFVFRPNDRIPVGDEGCIHTFNRFPWSVAVANNIRMTESVDLT